jgi:hypothetical protein
MKSLVVKAALVGLILRAAEAAIRNGIEMESPAMTVQIVVPSAPPEVPPVVRSQVTPELFVMESHLPPAAPTVAVEAELFPCVIAALTVN